MGDTNYGDSTNAGGGYSKNQNPPSPYGKNQPTTAPPKPAGPQLSSVRIHLCTADYNINSAATNDDFIKFFIEGPEIQGSPPPTKPDPNMPPVQTLKMTRWAALGIPLVVIPVANDAKTVKNDLAASLSTPGAFVIYLGHSFIWTDTKGNPVKVLLNPKHVKKEMKGYNDWLISANELTKMINAGNYKASGLLLCACSSKHCVGKINSKNKYIIGLDSGKNLVTAFSSMSFAIETILDNILGYAVVDPSKGYASRTIAIPTPQLTLKKAVGLGHAALQYGGVTDKLIFLNGDGNITYNITP